MKVLVALILIGLTSLSANAACNSYLVDNNGEGEVIQVFKSNGFFGIFFACSVAYKKCLRNAERFGEETICIKKRQFEWRQVQELAHEIDKKAKLLHRDLEALLGVHEADHDNTGDDVINRVHELAENANALHEAVEESSERSGDTYEEYTQVKESINEIKYLLNEPNLPNEIWDTFSEIDSLFLELRSFYWARSWF